MLFIIIILFAATHSYPPIQHHKAHFNLSRKRENHYYDTKARLYPMEKCIFLVF